MKIQIEFDNPLSNGSKVKKIFTIKGKQKEYYTRQLIDMASHGMIMIPADIEIEMSDGNKESISVILSTAAVERSYRGSINQRPQEEAPTVIDMTEKPKPRVWGKKEKQPFWARLLRRS